MRFMPEIRRQILEPLDQRSDHVCSKKIIATTGSMAFLSEELIAFSLKLKFSSIKSIIHLIDQISFAN